MPDDNERVLELLEELRKKIEGNETRVLGTSLPSINVWIFYCEYYDQVMNMHSLKGEETRFFELFDALELGNFLIDAHEPLAVSQEKAIDYVARMEKKLKGSLPAIQALDETKIATLFHIACAYSSNQLLLVKYPNLFGSDALAYSGLVVNGLLAMELFLKFLKAYELYDAGFPAHFIKSHDLLALYSDLSEERRKAIKSKLEDEYKCGDGLEDFLEKYRKDFVEYRYLLKKESYDSDVSFIAKINSALYGISKPLIDKGDLPVGWRSFSATYDADLRELAESCPFMVGEKLI